MKKWWKKVLMVLGTGGVVLAGANHYWKITPPAYEDNVLEISAPFTNVAVVGDTGEENEQRQWLVESLKRRPVRVLLMAGDNCYGIGCFSRAEFNKNFKKPFTDALPELVGIYVTQGNHDNLSVHEQERDWMIDLLKDGPVEKVHMKYYYTGYVFKDPATQKFDYCLATADNTMYMAKFGDPPAQDKQDKYLEKFFHDDRCVNVRRGLLWHIPVLSAGEHGDTKFKDQIALYHQKLRGWVHDMFSGHDHNLSFDGCYQNTCHWLSGAGSKLRPLATRSRGWASSVPGYLWITRIDEKTFRYQFIQVQKGSDAVIYETTKVTP